ncbi:unnamed protein product [Microthlaspi erraticum]|uniref:Uncharacterized protein n=1 Tax=Microthlaspi erraticum TaxID=1685480 RepID=A0A6D2L0G2_9BRAS|nr:unnamed protein product [Microthlaspi erraticum]
MKEAGDFGRSHVSHPWNPMSSSALMNKSDHEEEEVLCTDRKRRRKYKDSSVDFHVLHTDLNLAMLLKGNLARISVKISSKSCVFVSIAIGKAPRISDDVFDFC